MNEPKGNVLITGASSGIGEATAKELVQDGFQVILVARREDRLKHIVDELNTNGRQSFYLTGDLSKETECLRIYHLVQDRVGPLDVLINNAGLGWYGFSDEMPWSVARQMIEVNMTALTQLTFLFLPEMKRRNQGHIINVGSIVGSLPSQGVALYSGTKSFIDAFTTSLHRELKRTAVNASVVRAGAVATPFFQQTAHQPRSMIIPVERFTISPDVVAQAIRGIIHRPRRFVYVPNILRIVPWLELCFGWLMDRLGPLLLDYQRNLSPPPSSTKSLSHPDQESGAE
jgi:short-subunit dehydrogenase